MISRTLPRNRVVVAASADRNTIFSHRSCSMSSESVASIFERETASWNATARADLERSRSP